jgi:hypothetical protein
MEAVTQPEPQTDVNESTTNVDEPTTDVNEPTPTAAEGVAEILPILSSNETITTQIKMRKPKSTIIKIMWIEIAIGIFSIWLKPHNEESTNIAIMIALLVLIITIYYHCLSDVLPIYVEPRVPCVMC